MSEQRLNVKLVGEVEKRPVLYNFRLPGYTRKDETDKAWNEVGKAVNMTVAECKQRWKNLRAVFVRHVKPIKSGEAAKPKKAYYLLEAMQFTVPYIKTLDLPSGNLSNPPGVKEEEEGDQFEETDSNTTGQDSEPSSPFQQPPTTPPPIPPTPLHITPTTDLPQRKENLTQSQFEPSPSHIPNNTKRAMKNEAVDIAAIAYSQAKKARTSSSPDDANQDSKKEALRMFLLSMLPDLLTMSDEEVRLFKRKSLEVVDDIFSTRLIIASPQVVYSSTTLTKHTPGCKYSD